MNWLQRFFEHRHKWKNVGYVTHASEVNSASAGAVTANIYRCKCGEERRELTDAGRQQLGWGDTLNSVLGLSDG